jgi:hypothetical protein
MASMQSPKAKPTPSSSSDRLTPSEIASLRQNKRESVAKMRALLAKQEAAK